MGSDGVFLGPLEARVVRTNTGLIDALVFPTSWCDATTLKTTGRGGGIIICAGSFGSILASYRGASCSGCATLRRYQVGISPVLNPDDKVIIFKTFRGHVGLVAVECVVLGPTTMIEIR
jgi:hypothetical protein